MIHITDDFLDFYTEEYNKKEEKKFLQQDVVYVLTDINENEIEFNFISKEPVKTIEKTINNKITTVHYI